jgi:hypothetical protein
MIVMIPWGEGVHREGGVGPRKFILQLIFIHLFNLSPRSFVKLLCCSQFPATAAWEGGREHFPDAPRQRKCH